VPLAAWSEMNAGKVVQPNKDAAAEASSKDDGSGMVPSPRGPSGPGLRALGLTWSVLDMQSLGYGCVAWIKVGPGAQNVGVSARGVGLRIGETGQVPEIEIENLGDGAVLIPAHLVLSGGWQTRAVERSAVVPARRTARVPVKCIEAGRWAPRDERTGSTFEVAERTSVRTRWSTAVNMSEQLTRHGRFTAEQSAVWQHVEEELARTPEPSHTRSYEAYLRGVKRRHIEAVRAVRVRPPPEANAAVLFLRGGGVWMEAYPTPATLAEHADDLLADLFDATAKNETDVVDAPPVEALLTALWQLPTRDVERIAGTLGASRVIDGFVEIPEWSSLASITGALLTIDGALAHLTVGAPPGRKSARQIAPPAASQRPPTSSDVVETGASHLATSPVAPGSPGAPPPDAVAAAGARPVGLHAIVNPAPPSVRSSAEAFQSRALSSVRPDAPSSRSDARVVALVPRGHAPTPGGPKVSRETMRAVYERARELVPELPIAPQDVRGYRLLRALDGNVSWVDIRMGGDGYAVLGSHDRCDLVLSDDTGIWLRHLLACCVRLPDGSLGVRMIDLKTDIPFYLEDDAPQWSVTASGPFAVRLGRHVICGFPLGEASALAVDPPTGAVTFSAGPSAAVPAQTFPSLVRIDTPPPVRRRLGEPFTIVPSAPVSQIQDLIGPNSSPNHVRVTLERGGMGASVEIPADALDAGVLLGRALNCFDGGLRRIFCDAVSRAHVLLLADQGEVFALDLCTTNGTRVAGRRIRRYRLANEGATLELGKKVLFRWHRRVPEPAPIDGAGTSGPVAR
jgi:ARG/rhodanese/phosphatase superfamily protein/FHA domain-containing protein